MSDRRGQRQRRSRLNLTALAITIEGVVIANVAHADGPRDLKSIFQRAAAMNAEVFVGIVLTPKERTFVSNWLGESGAEVSGWIWGARQRRARRGARRRRGAP